MKNYWLRNHQSKKNEFFTVEFTDGGFNILRPRTIQVMNPSKILGCSGAIQENICLIFKGASLNVSDSELVQFFSKVKKNISGWKGVISYYQIKNTSSMNVFLSKIELNYLKFDKITPGKDTNDLNLFFDYAHLRHIW